MYLPRSPINEAYLCSENKKATKVAIKKHKKALSVVVADEKNFLISVSTDEAFKR